jgi:tetratricopeptide (TPR) repeat protein
MEARLPSIFVWFAFVAVTTILPAATHAQGAPTSRAAATAQEKQDASVHFRRGVELFEEGIFRAALVELNRAYEIAPDYRVLHNIGQVYFALGEYVESDKALERYLAEGGSDIAPARRAEIERQLTDVKKRVAFLTITVNRSGAKVLVDGTEVGTTPIGALLAVSVGRHRVSAQGDDGASASATVDVAGGDSKTVTLELSTRQVGAASGTPQEQAKGLSKLDKWGVGMLAGGAALGIAGAVLGLMANAAHDDYDAARRARPGDRTAIDSAHDDIGRYALGADVLLFSGLAAAVTGVVLIVWKEPASRETSTSQVGLGFGLHTLVAKGRF